jgi:CheY-like chemotaxis protein
MYRIAIVDDNETWCYVLQLVLDRHGFAASTFTDANQFLTVAQHFDLALIDFSMPTRPFQRELDGNEVITYLKQQLSNPPILVLTSAFFGIDTLDIAHQICPIADAYISKGDGMPSIVEFVKAMESNGAKQRAS